MEVKRSLSPRGDRGFHVACADLASARRVVAEAYPLGAGTEAMLRKRLAQELAAVG